MQQIERIVRDHGQRRNIVELQEYVSGIDVDEITLLIKKRIHNAEFSSFWNYLIQALDKEDFHEKRYDIITMCINEIKERNLTSPHANLIITRLCMELPKFLPRHLISLCVLCMGFIQNGDVTETCWRELLPEILNVIVEKPCVEFNLNEMSGVEFKIQFIKSLSMLQWSTNIIIPLTMMFIEMPLSKDEHLQVVNKLVSYIEKLTPQEIPAFTYQVLRFCQNQNSRLVFHKLQEYFDLRIYNNLLSSGVSNSEDIISDTVDEESIQAESTVLYHIYQSAILGHESIKEYISSLKNITKLPEFILHPFQLTVLLTISTVSYYEDKVFEIVRQCISRNFNEEIKKADCCWLRTLVPHALNIEDVIIKIVHNSSNERDLVTQGLVNLGFILLSVGALLGRDSLIVKKQWNLGKFILLTLVKEKPYVAHAILQRLCNHIVTGNSINQYVDCFRDFSTKNTYVTLENKSCIIELMEALMSVPENCAEIILDIVIPLTKVSPTIRDHLILLLRKALYSRSSETRQVAVRGFLKLLAKQKISNLTVLSQINSSSSSGHSVLTQISLHRSGHTSQSQAFSSEALCLDVLNILKRCYMQQADIRSQLYVGLHEAVNQNPDLVLPVLNLLWAQFLKYYNIDETVLPPVDFSKLSIIRDADVIVQEPIGQLTSAISFLIVKIQELEDEDTNCKKYMDIFDSMCNRLIKCELIHFELDDGSDLTDILPECKKKVATLKEAMTLYECLIGYEVWSWNKSSQKRAEQIVGLFQGYFRLQHCAKNATKSKKVERKKKDGQQNRQTQRTQASEQNRRTQGQAQTSSQDQNGRQNTSVFKGPKAVPIKLPHTVLNFKVLIKFLNLLHGNVDWTSQQQANLLKVKQDIHQHILQATISQLQLLKNRKGIERNKDYYNYCKDIAQIIYPKCIERLEEFIEFDVTTAALAVECFDIIISIVSINYTSDLKQFLYAIGSHENEAVDLLTCLSPFIQKYQNLLKMDSAAADDQEFKKVLEVIVNTLSILVSQIPVNSNVLINKFLDWMKMYATDYTIATRNAAINFANLWFSTYIKYKSTLSIFEDVISNLYVIYGSLSEEHEGSQTLKIINELTVVTFVQCLTNAIKTLLDNIDWMTNRLRSEHGVMVYSGGEGSERRKENLSDRERSVSCQMCLNINLVEALCNVKVPIGLSEYIIKNVLCFYTNLNGLTKYFILRSSKVNPAYQSARFERVVKLAGKRLAPTWNKFILYLEEIQTEEVDNTQAKKKNSTSLKNKILKETKLIPKVVYETEQFTKSIIQLSNKTKLDLALYIGAGTTRDFRIRDIKNVMEKNKSMDVTQSDIESNDRSTIEEVEEEESANEDGPPSKRSKT